MNNYTNNGQYNNFNMPIRQNTQQDVFIPTIPMTIDKNYIAITVTYSLVAMFINCGVIYQEGESPLSLNFLVFLFPLIYNSYYRIACKKKYVRLNLLGIILTDLAAFIAASLILHVIKIGGFKFFMYINIMRNIAWLMFTQFIGRITLRIYERHQNKVEKDIEKQRKQWEKKRGAVK